MAAVVSVGLAQPVTLTVAQGADPVTLDPHGQNDQPSVMGSMMLLIPV